MISRKKLFKALSYEPQEYQIDIHSSIDSNNRTIALFGRQSGKTTLAAHELIFQALLEKNRVIYIVSDTYAHAFKLLELSYLKLLDSPLKPLIKKFYKGSNLRLELNNGSKIIAKSADNPSSLAGDTVHFVCLEESGFISNDALAILLPVLARYNGKVLAIGTPDNRNWYYEWYQRCITGTPGYIAVHSPSSSNKYLSKEFLENAQKESTSKQWRKYYLAEFVDDEGAIFPNELIDGVTTLEKSSDYISGNKYIAGIDLADKSDYTYISILDTTRKPFKLVHTERFNKLGWTLNKQRIISTLKKWNAKALVDETGIGAPIIPDLKEEYWNIEGFTFTNKTKSDLIVSLELSFEKQELLLYKEPVLDSELRSIRATYTKNSISYAAPSGLHDDAVFSLCLANYAAKQIPSITVMHNAGIYR
jgi:Terminase large subunit, T4likevirus-type, N-terminal/Terminase RNaseH-like domain